MAKKVRHNAMGLEIFKDYKCDGQMSIENYLNENNEERKEGEEENGEEQEI